MMQSDILAFHGLLAPSQDLHAYMYMYIHWCLVDGIVCWINGKQIRASAKGNVVDDAIAIAVSFNIYKLNYCFGYIFMES